MGSPFALDELPQVHRQSSTTNRPIIHGPSDDFSQWWPVGSLKQRFRVLVTLKNLEIQTGHYCVLNTTFVVINFVHSISNTKYELQKLQNFRIKY